ncbi:hypothetical protein [Nannocystis radixulma]|uniref:Uncharacterized protein n=1 Tax=Nannocystis radixulma TaxID=2995305 RepID=A0ABT5B5Q0_9BACT|nr:hypothetical protein [Nannocystis radixulma]MDC0669416.1 hypothetical protein [Nannocystis radixulma]
MRTISKLSLAALFTVSFTACPADEGETTETTAATPATEASATMTPATATENPTGTEGTMGTEGTDTEAPTTGVETTGNGGAGFCAQTCAAVADCVPMGGNEADYACTDGFCEYKGQLPACDDTTCPAAAGAACAEVGGVTQCTFPCTEGGTECDVLQLECTGMNDAGEPICAAKPCGGVAEGAACEIAGFGQLGVCTDGVCSCSADTECTAMGYACNQ